MGTTAQARSGPVQALLGSYGKFALRNTGAQATRLSQPVRCSFFDPLVGAMRLAQIEFSLDPAPGFVFELAGAIQLIDLLPFGSDEQ